MANELDNLRPEVRRANSFLDSMACSEDERAAVHTIRAELLRLVGDLNAACLSRDTFEAKYQCMRERAERAEAELAAIKAEIAEAPWVDAGCLQCLPHGAIINSRGRVQRWHELDAVRLLVEK